MTNINPTSALPRSKPYVGYAGHVAGIAAGFATSARPFAVVILGVNAMASLGHESSDYGHNAQCKQGVIRGGLSM